MKNSLSMVGEGGEREGVGREGTLDLYLSGGSK